MIKTKAKKLGTKKNQTRFNRRFRRQVINVMNLNLGQKYDLVADGERRYLSLRALLLQSIEPYRVSFQQCRLNHITIDLQNIRHINGTPAIPMYYYVRLGGDAVDPHNEPGRKYTQGRRVLRIRMRGRNTDFGYWFSPADGGECKFEGDIIYQSDGHSLIENGKWVADVKFNVSFKMALNPNTPTLQKIPDDMYSGILQVQADTLDTSQQTISIKDVQRSQDFQITGKQNVMLKKRPVNLTKNPPEILRQQLVLPRAKPLEINNTGTQFKMDIKTTFDGFYDKENEWKFVKTPRQYGMLNEYVFDGDCIKYTFPYRVIGKDTGHPIVYITMRRSKNGEFSYDVSQPTDEYNTAFIKKMVEDKKITFWVETMKLYGGKGKVIKRDANLNQLGTGAPEPFKLPQYREDPEDVI